MDEQMTDQPKIWRDMTDAEKGALLLADNEGETIEYYSVLFDNKWRPMSVRGSSWLGDNAYRVKPKAPKVETYVARHSIWGFGDGSFATGSCHAEKGIGGFLCDITHTYTITDNVVTACETTIHQKED